MKAKKKKKLSGAAYRKQRRQRLAKTVTGQLIRMPEVGRLETLQDWRVQIARIYRRTATGELPEFIGTKLAFIANLGATLAKAADELKELQNLREQLARLQDAPPAGLITSNSSHNDLNGASAEGD